MTTNKKKSAPKSGDKKTKSVAEPAATTARASMKKEKAPKAAKPAEQPAPEVVIEVASAAPAPATQAPTTPTPTPMPAPVVEGPAPAAAVAKAEKPVLTVGMFQKRLHEHGYYQGWWDGDYGPLTRQAVIAFQRDKGLPADGEPTEATLAALGF